MKYSVYKFHTFLCSLQIAYIGAVIL